MSIDPDIIAATTILYQSFCQCFSGFLYSLCTAVRYSVETTTCNFDYTKTPNMAPQQQSWLTRTTNAAAAGVGNFTGGIVNAAGNAVAGAGRGAGAR